MTQMTQMPARPISGLRPPAGRAHPRRVSHVVSAVASASSAALVILFICVSACVTVDIRPSVVELLPRDANDELQLVISPTIDPTTMATTRLGAVGGREVFSSRERNAGSTRTVLFERADRSSALWPLLEVGFEDGLFNDGSAELIATPDRTFLVIRVDVPGTGNFNADVVLHWNGRGWVEVDAAKWLADFELPRCYEIWKGARADLEAFRGRSAVWVEGDANCCPSGGEVTATLELRDRAIRVRSQEPKLVPLETLRKGPERAEALKACEAGTKP